VFYPSASADQSYKLARFPYLEITPPDDYEDADDDSDVIGVDAESYIGGLGKWIGAWRVRRSLLRSGPTDKHVMVRVDQTDKATVYFGNGTLGKIPNQAITFTYEYGGGVAGRVAAGALTTIEGSITSYEGRQVSLAVSNAAPSSGGERRETVNEARINGPASLAATTRTITREDFEARGRQAGAGRALMMTTDEDPAIDDNTGRIYLVSSTGGAVSQAVIDETIRLYTSVYPKLTGFRVSVNSATFRPMNIRAVVFPQEGLSPAVVRGNIEASLAALFAPLNTDGTPNEFVNFGFYFRDQNDLQAVEPAVAFSDVYNAVRDSVGVRKMSAIYGDFTINGTTGDVTILDYEFPILGEVIVINARTGLAI
jgi:hypothetical protein